jgi:ribosomal protein L32E
MKLADKSKPYRELRRLFEEDYSAVMLGKKRPSSAIGAVRELEKESRRIKALKSGRSSTGAQSVPSKLTMVLASFNKCAARTDLKVEKITVTKNNIRISGNTSSRKNTLTLRQAIERTGLKILNDTAEEKGGRDVFVITVEPKKQSKETL